MYSYKSIDKHVLNCNRSLLQFKTKIKKSNNLANSHLDLENLRLSNKILNLSADFKILFPFIQ